MRSTHSDLFVAIECCHSTQLGIEQAQNGLCGGKMSVISASVGKGGTNRKPDVRAVQCLLNLNSNMVQSGLKAKLALNGSLDTVTQEAVDLYQRTVMKLPKPDGRVDSHGGMIRRLEAALPALPNGSFADPPWLKIACDEEAAAVKESSGRAANHPRILQYLATARGLATNKDVTTAKKADGTKEIKETGYMMSQVDETAWCACFVNWCLAQVGETPQPGAGAQTYATYGKSKGDTGAICVIKREPFNDSSTGSHVGFYIGGSPREGYVALLGGNQNNSVCRKWFVGLEPTKIWQRWPG
jgi:uncharacterized protein (TIGR02594 family)